MTRRGPLTATLLVLALALAGCGGAASKGSASSPSPSASSPSADASACQAVTTGLLASVQKYVDAYGAPLTGSSSSSGGTTGGDDTELRSSLQQAQSELAAKHCDLPTFREDFAAGLEKVTAKGPLARAVLLRLTASMTGTLSTTAQTIELKPGDDLARRLAALAPGSTARLAAGEYRLAQPLVLLAGITLRGAGRARTTVSSKAAGSAILVLTSGRVELRDLALVHVGKAPSTVLVGGPSSSVVLTSARVSGGKGARGTAGQGQAGTGTGVSMTARADETRPRGTTLQVTRSELSGNDAAGILLTGAHRASVRGTTFRDNAQCGICFAGSSAGAVRGSTFTGNTVGAAVFDRSTPLLVQDVFTGGQVGVQVSGDGAPQVRDVRVGGATRAGFIYSENANGRVDGATCTGTPYGIVVGPKAYPYLATVDCQLAKGR